MDFSGLSQDLQQAGFKNGRLSAEVDTDLNRTIALGCRGTYLLTGYRGRFIQVEVSTFCAIWRNPAMHRNRYG